MTTSWLQLDKKHIFLMGVLFWKSALTITLYKVARFTLLIQFTLLKSLYFFRKPSLRNWINYYFIGAETQILRLCSQVVLHPSKPCIRVAETKERKPLSEEFKAHDVWQETVKECNTTVFPSRTQSFPPWPSFGGIKAFEWEIMRRNPFLVFME